MLKVARQKTGYFYAINLSHALCYNFKWEIDSISIKRNERGEYYETNG